MLTARLNNRLAACCSDFCEKMPHPQASPIKCWLVRTSPLPLEVPRQGVLFGGASRLVLILLISAPVQSASGQAISGSILGVVTDPTGGLVVDAHVTIVNSGTGLSFT